MLEKQGVINTCGIYGIFDDAGICLIVGSSKECNDRYSHYKWSLENRKFENTNKQALQKLYDAGKTLIFKVIEECEENQLIELENYYINKLQSICNRNTAARRKSKPSKKETKHRSEINKGSRNPNSKFKEEDILEILRLDDEGVDRKEIAEKFNTTYKYITAIVNGHKWSHIVNRYKKEKSTTAANSNAIHVYIDTANIYVC